MSRVRIPTVLRADTAGARELEVDADTVGEALTRLIQAFPGLTDRVLRDGAIQPFLNVYLDGEDVETLAGLRTPVHPESVILLLPAMAGGDPAFSRAAR